MERLALILLLAAAAPAWGFDAGGVAIGDPEAAVKKAYPEARCAPMEWKTDAADRRCDASPAKLGAIEARITFYLRKDEVQAFDARMDDKDLRAAVAYLKQRYGRPDFEGKQTFQRRGDAREVFKVRWTDGEDQAELTAMASRRRVDLNVWRGNFNTEVYRVR